METIEVKYRNWYKGKAPKPLKLEIPGWAGEQNRHTNGDKPQPWHCLPFVEANTYGLELNYCFDTECRVYLENGNLIFSGDFSEEQKLVPEVTLPPFMAFAPGHFGLTSALDLKIPEGYVTRTEPHPRFYTDTTGTVPCCIPGHIQSQWWPKIFFIVFKNPLPGQTLIFRKDDPVAQILILPRKVNYDLKEMSLAEKSERNLIDNQINKHAKKICKNDWKDHLNNNFDDKYKVLSGIYAKKGVQGVNTFLDSLNHNGNKKMFRGKFVKRNKDEGIQDQEKKS